MTHQISKKSPHSVQTTVVSSTQNLQTNVETQAQSLQMVVDTHAQALQTVVETQVQTRQTVVVTQTQIRQIHENHGLQESHAFFCSCSHRSHRCVHVVSQSLHRCDQVVSQSRQRCSQTRSQLRQASVVSVRQETQRTVRHFTGRSSRQHPDQQPDERPEPHEHGQSSDQSRGACVVGAWRVALVRSRSNVLGTFVLHSGPSVAAAVISHAAAIVKDDNPRDARYVDKWRLGLPCEPTRWSPSNHPPRGGLVLMWNEPDKPTEPSIAAAGALLNERGSSERQIDRYASGAWRKAFAGSSFEELNEARFEHRQVVDREQLLAYFASMSWIAVLPDEEREELLNEVRGLLEADAYTRFWRADVYWTRLAA
jgi:hypothetical protein